MMGTPKKNHWVIILQLQAIFQGGLFVEASLKSDNRKASQDELKIVNGKEIKADALDNLLYYLPTESILDSTRNLQTTTTSPPHITIDPASVHTMSEPTVDVFGKLDLHDNDDYIIPYASQCISDLPSTYESEYFSELLTPSKNLIPEPVLSGHIEIASKTSNEGSKDFKKVSGSSVVLEGSHIYMASITKSE